MIQKVTIGRNPDNHIVISHPAVSGYHADLIVDDSLGYEQYTFIDHSTNGTMVNGQYLRNASCFVVYNDSIILAGSVAFDWKVLGSVRAFVRGMEPVNNPGAESVRGGMREDITFTGALKGFFNNYVDFKGRSTRKEFWFTYLWLLIFSAVLSLLTLSTTMTTMAGVFSGDMDEILSPMVYLYGMGWTFYLWMIYDLALFIPSLSLLVRRIHDAGYDGLWILMLLIPIVNIIFFFVWTLTPSEPGPNKWGRSK